MTKEKLILAIERSQKAFDLYLDGRKYFQARRIYSANKEIYRLLEAYLVEAKEEKGAVIDYLFHLDDWFLQFENTVTARKPEIEDEFVFERTLGSFAYPKDFYTNLIKG